jgi:hypothetical protein
MAPPPPIRYDLHVVHLVNPLTEQHSRFLDHYFDIEAAFDALLWLVEQRTTWKNGQGFHTLDAGRAAWELSYAPAIGTPGQDGQGHLLVGVRDTDPPTLYQDTGPTSDTLAMALQREVSTTLLTVALAWARDYVAATGTPPTRVTRIVFPRPSDITSAHA